MIEAHDLETQDDDTFERLLKAANDLDELKRAREHWDTQTLRARKRALTIAHRMDQIRGS